MKYEQRATPSSLVMPHPLLCHTVPRLCQNPSPAQLISEERPHTLLPPHCSINTDCQPVLDRFDPAREPGEAHRAGRTHFSFWHGCLFFSLLAGSRVFTYKSPNQPDHGAGRCQGQGTTGRSTFAVLQVFFSSTSLVLAAPTSEMSSHHQVERQHLGCSPR